MALINWDDSLSVGISIIDEQHKKLIGLINEFYEALKENRAKEALGEVIKGMIDYTNYHFSAEEKYMDQYNFPGYEAHKKEHAHFVAKATDLQSRLAQGRLVVSVEVTNFLKEWLTKHIKNSDKNYSHYFSEKGFTIE